MRKGSLLLMAFGLAFSLSAQDEVVNTTNLEMTKIGISEGELLASTQLDQKFAYFLKGMNYLEKNPESIKELVGNEFYFQAKGIKTATSLPTLFKAKPSVEPNRPTEPSVLTVISIGESLAANENKEELIKQYSNAYNLLPVQFRTGLAVPLTVKNYSLTNLQAANAKIDGVFRSNRDAIVDSLEASNSSSSSSGDIATWSCSLEDGAVVQQGENEISDRCNASEYASNGLMKNNSFRMKNDLTCVKDQGQRGTCVAFAVTAAVETRASIEGNGRRNFSEQFAWFDAKVHYDWRDRYEYGTSSKSLIKGLYRDEKKIPMENNWEYNRSSDIGELNESTNKHPNSCLNYDGEMCTNYAFQSKESKDGRDWVYTIPSRGSDGRRIKDYDSFFNFLRKEHSLDKAIAYISNKKPVVLGFEATNRFNTAESRNGYTNYSSTDGEIGGHAILLVGFIKNKNVPSSAPAADEEGYFIAKNSWGLKHGDCGYYYLSYKYVRKQAHSLVAILD